MINKQDYNNSLYKKYSLEIAEFRKAVLSYAIRENEDLSNDLLFKKFFDYCYSYISVDYASEKNIPIFARILTESFAYFKNGPKISINYESSQFDEYTNIIILHQDRQFIIDSIKNLFNDLNIEIQFLIHPIIKVIRSDNKIEICGSEESSNKYINESLVYIKISSKLDEYITNKIYHSLLSLLDSIDKIHSTESEILNQVDLAIKKLEICYPGYDCAEMYDYINWLKEGNFIFLSHVSFVSSDSKKNLVNFHGLSDLCKNEELLFNIIDYACLEDNKSNIIICGKINTISPINKKKYIDYILIKNLDESQNNFSGSIFFGNYNYALDYQSARNIPVLRKKFQKLIDDCNFIEESYNHKKISIIFEALPRDLLFRISSKNLYLYSMCALSAMSTGKLRFMPDNNLLEGFSSCLIFLPSARLTPQMHDRINSYLKKKLEREIVYTYYDFIGHDFGYVYVLFNGNTEIENILEIELELTNLTNSWDESLLNLLIDHKGRKEAIKTFKYYNEIFPKDYKEYFLPDVAIRDLKYIMNLSSKESDIEFYAHIQNDILFLNIYSENKLHLSDIIPYIENLGFDISDEQVFFLNSSKYSSAIWLHEFEMKANSDYIKNFSAVKLDLEDLLRKMYAKLIENDILCKLAFLASMKWQQISILQSLITYLQQTGFNYSKEYVRSVIIAHASYAQKIIELFEIKFSPEKNKDELRENQINEFLAKYLETVAVSSEDKVLRAITNIINAIIRTNAYQENKFSKYISFKIQSSKIPHLPLPIPYAEIFVYSVDFEGIHLRGGPVARGGLRWSDRAEDYRTEVLGLMKAQMTKNSVIVPVGSKGAFLIKIDKNNYSKEEYSKKVVECYQNFLRGLLDLTDNIINNKIIKPINTICLDSDDPYLVVAADKGTASFSDYANQVSKEYNFWLQDAFASGGSAGYDHKKMAITARGGFVAVKRHFAEIGINAEKEEISVVGIGDMSGDVFGNLLLLSKNFKLIAAFNHIHIFIDPNPDCKKSYDERLRLFNMPYSQWKDYSQMAISQGGGVFSRKDKIIKLSKEIQELFELTIEEISPDELIKIILKANVDLLWNGGIGTYVKASTESHNDVSDKNNDSVRVNADELRAKVIGEGGNLGFSQLARIEFSSLGGKINTDFIDNSGGVDCSDHEVNIKIALNLAMISGKLNLQERDELLSKMKEDVANLVLLDNYHQTFAISFMENAKIFTLESFEKLMQYLENRVGLNREVEFLPSQTKIHNLIAENKHLTRPELAVLLSYSKMALYDEIINTKLLKEPYLDDILYKYFPKEVIDICGNDIKSHPLRKEIINTVISNEMVNRLSGIIIHQILSETGAPVCDIARAYIIVKEIFAIDDLWDSIDSINYKINLNAIIEIYTEINKLLRRGIFWVIKNFDSLINIGNIISDYKNLVVDISLDIENYLAGDSKDKYKKRLTNYKSSGFSDEISIKAAKMDILISVLDIALISKKFNQEYHILAKTYFSFGDILKLDWLRKNCDKLLTNDYWNRLAIQSLKDDLYYHQRKILEKMVMIEGADLNIQNWKKRNIKNMKIYDNFIMDLKSMANIDLNLMMISVKKLKIFYGDMNI